MKTVIRATLSGSFHKDSIGLQLAYDELVHNQCQVLSPHRLDFIDESALFVRDSAEQDESIRSLEAHHLRAIAQSDFLWVHAPEGYVGKSTAMEIGYAVGLGKPIFSAHEIEDQTLAVFVEQKPSVFMAIASLQRA